MIAQRLRNIGLLGVKELRSLSHDYILIIFVIYAFTVAIISGANGISADVHNAAVGVVDEDRSILTTNIINALNPPEFKTPEYISIDDVDPGMDAGQYGFVLIFPPGFEADVLAGRQPEMQVNIDATLILQAQVGASYIANIINDELTRFVSRSDTPTALPLNLEARYAFNTNGESSWFTSITLLIEMVTMLTIVLTGAALIREREHGTIEHLLVLPVAPFEIAMAKVWANGLVILAAAALSLTFVVRGFLSVPVAGSVPLYMLGVSAYLFFACALGVFLGTVTRSMPQFALLTMMTVLPMMLLQGGLTPIESQPEWLQVVTLALPNRHFVSFSQAILFRGAGFDVVWPNFLTVFAIGLVLLVYAIARFRIAISR